MIRSFAPGDVPLIGDTWRSSYASSDWARFVSSPNEWRAVKGQSGRKQSYAPVYWNGQRARVDRLLASNVVLVDEADDGLIDGWICGWPRTTLHYVYVRQGRRGRGVARALLAALELRPGSPVRYSHRAAGIRGNPHRWTFDKYLADAPRIEERETMAKHRISMIAFVADTAITWRNPLSGSIEKYDTLTEKHHVDAELNDATGLVTLHSRATADSSVKDIVVHVSRVRWLECYPPGELPKWMREEEAAKKAGAAA